MFRRIFWLTVGVVVGVLIWRKVTKVAHSYTPDGLAERAQTTAARTADGLRAFARDVQSVARAKERELREELAAHTPDDIPGPQAQHRRRRRGDGREFRTP